MMEGRSVLGLSGPERWGQPVAVAKEEGPEWLTSPLTQRCLFEPGAKLATTNVSPSAYLFKSPSVCVWFCFLSLVVAWDLVVGCRRFWGTGIVRPVRRNGLSMFECMSRGHLFENKFTLAMIDE